MPIKRHTKLSSSVQCPTCHINMWQMRDTRHETRYQCSLCGLQRVVFKTPAPIQCPPNDAA